MIAAARPCVCDIEFGILAKSAKKINWSVERVRRLEADYDEILCTETDQNSTDREGLPNSKGGGRIRVPEQKCHPWTTRGDLQVHPTGPTSSQH